jgi:hypothetical protein
MQLTFDMFSGRTNPSWRLPPIVSRQVFDLIGDSGLLPWISSELFPARLGYRGLQIVLPPEVVQKYRVSPWLNLSADAFGHVELFKELAAIARFAGFFGFDEFQKLVRTILEFLLRPAGPSGTTSSGPPAGPCAFEMLPFDPAPWNDPAFKPTNNCYAYAANKRARYPKKPQPGIGSGAEYSSETCADVSAAAKRDGAHDVGDCFPDSEAPRMLVALVMWPGNDYHWYRKHPDCWGHKPGSWDARNVDDSGAIITNPQTCDRGPYTEFCGYMLLPKSQKVAA